MLNILKKILEKKCGNCGSILRKDNTKAVNLKKFELINYVEAMKKFRESPRPSYLIEVLICETCHVNLQNILGEKREEEKKRLIQQNNEQEEQRYLDALRKQVELKRLEKQAIELGIDLDEL